MIVRTTSARNDTDGPEQPSLCSRSYIGCIIMISCYQYTRPGMDARQQSETKARDSSARFTRPDGERDVSCRKEPEVMSGHPLGVYYENASPKGDQMPAECQWRVAAGG